MSSEKIKIGFLTALDAADKRTWSGTLFNMVKSLRENVGEVVLLGPVHLKYTDLFFRGLNKILLKLFKKKYNYKHSHILARKYNREFRKRIKQQKPSIIIAGTASTELSLLNVPQPKIYIGDITFALLNNYYQNYSNLFKSSSKESDNIDGKAMKQSEALIFSSQWAADSAINDYNIEKEKVHIISYGANMDYIPSTEEATNKQYDETCRLLFLAVDWNRKGGDLVLKTLNELDKTGFKYHLTICGCVPPVEINNENVTVISYLNKNNAEDLKKLSDLLLQSHLLFVPSRADCTPIVFNEANSFGLPIITTSTGGIPSLINEGVNGKSLSIEANEKDYAKLIEEVYSNEKNYLDFVKSSRQYYEDYLNWNIWGKRMKTIIQNILA
ncbi:MAG: glycosyltransferase family 4 protein [Bacteroidales bacterium]|nr:glycosyltransferase family 4 protein [Bacteroidales bacterium]